MINKVCLLVLLTLAGSNVFSIDNEILSITPNNIKSGDTTDITIILNSPVDEGLEVSIYIWGYGDHWASWTVIYYTDDFIIADSVLTGKVYLPLYMTPPDSVVISMQICEPETYCPDSLIYRSFQVDGGIYGLHPEICMVSQNESNQNVVIWDALEDELVDSVIIYKETSVSDEFIRIGSRSIQDSSLFIDHNSLNAQNSSRYQIALTDTSENESFISAAHKTMHLTLNAGINGSVNLIWDKYEGFDYSTYHVYRGSTPDDMVKIAEIASNLFTFSDIAPPLGTLYYQLVIENPYPCNIGMAKSTLNDYQYCKSNIVDNNAMVGLSVRMSSKNSFSVFPNPGYGRFMIENDQADFTMLVYTINGNVILKQNCQGRTQELNLEAYPAGVYFIKMVDAEGSATQRIIKE
ncbi:MAG: T9SS type A sorting domain-containing protein [Bacteroidales bacterium]|nr:T9SS type A sorting domain-containing protein [Bacteroidales bacterium]